MALKTKDFEGQTVESLKTLVAKQIGVPRFRQRWLSEDHSELQEASMVSASDVQLVVLDFVQPEELQVKEFFRACDVNDLEEVEALLRKPLNPNLRGDRKGTTALHIAAGSGHVECCALLLEAGGNKDQATRRGTTPLHVAAWNGHPKVVSFLLEVGVNKDSVELQGTTALHCAAWAGHQEVLCLLLAAAAKISPESDGCTPLHCAASMGHHQIVRSLLEALADASLVDSQGRSPMDMAKLVGHRELLELFNEAPAPKAPKRQRIK